MEFLPPVGDDTLGQDENVIEEKNAAFLHELVDISDRPSAYQYPLLAGAGWERVALAQHVGDKVYSLPVDLSKLVVLVYLADAPYGVIKLHCGELPVQLEPSTSLWWTSSATRAATRKSKQYLRKQIDA